MESLNVLDFKKVLVFMCNSYTEKDIWALWKKNRQTKNPTKLLLRVLAVLIGSSAVTLCEMTTIGTCTDSANGAHDG